MKKLLSILLSVMLMTSVMAFFPLRGSAEAGGMALPDFEYPRSRYGTFAETGIPYDAILSCFPEQLEIKYEDGILKVKDFGGDFCSYVDWCNYDFHDGVLVDGYWHFEVSSEAYNAGGDLSMYTDDHAWHAEYRADGERRIITISSDEDGNKCLKFYPTDGYGEQYVQVSYDLYNGIVVTDTYKEGVFYDQSVCLYMDGGTIWIDYDAQGQICRIDVAVDETDEYAHYIPDKGWSDSSSEYLPVDPPTGYESATLEDLIALAPTDIGCEHRWNDPRCDVPGLCSVCWRENKAPNGHSWVSGEEYDTCSVCNGVLYRAGDIGMPSFENRPYLTTEKAGVDTDAILAMVPPSLTVKYENGVLMMPCIDGYRIDVMGMSGFYDSILADGWNHTTVAEEELDGLRIIYDKVIENGDESIWYELEYTPAGKFVSIDIFDSESGRSIFVDLSKDRVKLTYPKDGADNTDYTDTYVDGNLVSQLVNDRKERIKVYYNSDLEIEKVVIFMNGEYLTLTPDKGWVVDDDEDITVPTPEGYEDKDIAYYASRYPHNIDFCIHDWKDVEDGKECVKCGEIAAKESEPKIGKTVVIAIVSVCAVAVVAAVIAVILVKKKKSK